MTMKLLQLFTLSQALNIASGRRLNENRPDNNRIIGGKELVAGRFPYAVALSDSIGQFCGGSLIAEDIVLTAGEIVRCTIANLNADGLIYIVYLLSALPRRRVQYCGR
jgi:secreted trypsin-like serine protease